jgi:hypothetical protein
VFDRLGWALDVSERIGIWHDVVNEWEWEWYVVYTRNHSLAKGGLKHFLSVEGGPQKWRLINGI